MATIRTNPLVNGMSGMLGNFVFKNYRGTTIVTSRPSLPKTQSAQQKDNRTKFKQATAWAKEILLIPARKEYYQKKAKKLKLPNAYTTAITDYMRNPRLTTSTNHNKSITCTVSKNNFELKAVEVVFHHTTGTTAFTRVIEKDKYGEWIFRISEKERRLNDIDIKVTNEAGKITYLRLN